MVIFHEQNTDFIIHAFNSTHGDGVTVNLIPLDIKIIRRDAIRNFRHDVGSSSDRVSQTRPRGVGAAGRGKRR